MALQDDPYAAYRRKYGGSSSQAVAPDDPYAAYRSKYSVPEPEPALPTARAIEARPPRDPNTRPFVTDTLAPAAGRSLPITRVPDGTSAVIQQPDGRASIELAPSRSDDEALTHEFGHVAGQVPDERGDLGPARDLMPRLSARYGDFVQRAGPQDPDGQDRNANEYAASTYAQAMQLRRRPQAPTADELAALDVARPGIREAWEHLGTRPPFARPVAAPVAVDRFGEARPGRTASRPANDRRSRETSIIPAEREAEFREWATRNRVTDLDDPRSFYDYRGAFLAGVDRDPGEDGHFPDTFKQHGHPTFSNESRYATPGDPEAGRWEGETYVAPRRPAPPAPRMPDTTVRPDATAVSIPQSERQLAAEIASEQRRPSIGPGLSPTNRAEALARTEAERAALAEAERSTGLTGGFRSSAAAMEGMVNAVTPGQPATALARVLRGSGYIEEQERNRRAAEMVGKDPTLLEEAGHLVGMLPGFSATGAIARPIARALPLFEDAVAGTQALERAAAPVRGAAGVVARTAAHIPEAALRMAPDLAAVEMAQTPPEEGIEGVVTRGVAGAASAPAAAAMFAPLRIVPEIARAGGVGAVLRGLRRAPIPPQETLARFAPPSPLPRTGPPTAQAPRAAPAERTPPEPLAGPPAPASAPARASAHTPERMTDGVPGNEPPLEVPPLIRSETPSRPMESTLPAPERLPELPKVEPRPATQADVDAMLTSQPEPAPFQRIRTETIQMDPARFQFKRLGEEGVGRELKNVKTWNDRFAGIISVWRDPADGQTYVVNGHHRLDLARRLGVQKVNVQYVDAPTAEKARAEGAFINIAENRGTPMDVAKFLRDYRATPEDLEQRGVSLRADLAERGLALSRLAPDLFDAVARGEMSPGHGAAIGRTLETPEMQRAAASVVRGDGKRMSEAEVAEVARQVRDAGTENVTQDTLFGTEQQSQALFGDRARLAVAFKKRLSGDRRLFGYITAGDRPEQLSRVGDIDVGKATKLGEESGRVEELFDRLYTRSGPIAEIVTDGARRIARGEKPGAVVADLYPRLSDAVQLEVTRAGSGPVADVPERGAPAEVRDAAPGGAPERAEGAEPPPFVDPNQDALFSPRRRSIPAGETVKAAAIRSQATGRYYVAANHGDAFLKARESGDAGPFDDLFQTSSGRYVGREEAYGLAEKRGQIDDAPEVVRQREQFFGGEHRELHARDVPELGRREPPADDALLSPARRQAEPEMFGAEQVNPGMASEIQRAYAFYQRAIQQETGESLAATVRNLRDSIANFAEKGASESGLADLRRLAERSGAPERPSLRLTSEHTTPEQSSMFGAREGTAASRSLAETEAAARSELGKLREMWTREQDPARRADLGRQIAEREKLVNRGQAISADEMRARAATEPPRETVDGQMALLSPDTSKAVKQAADFTPEDAGDVKALIQISRNLADAVGVPLRQGRFRAAARRAAGVFFPFKEVTRVERYDAVDTVAHEIGHYVSKKYLRNPMRRGAAARGVPRPPREALRELVQMGRELYGKRKPNAGYGEEGIAEWFSFYVTEPATNAAKAPHFSAWMEAVLQRDPLLRATIDQGQADFARFQAAPAEAKIEAMIARKVPAALPNVRTMMRLFLDDVYEFEAALRDLGRSPEPSQNAYTLARLSRGAAGVAEEWLDRGVTTWRRNAAGEPEMQRVGQGIVPALRAVGPKRMAKFERYLIAESALERHGNGINPGIGKAEATEIAEAGRADPVFKDAAQAVWDHYRALIGARVDAGLLLPEEARRILDKNQRHVAFYRMLETKQESGAGRARGFSRSGSGVKRQHGSALEILPPIESIVKDTYDTATQVARYRAAKALIESVIETEGAGRIIEEVPAPQRIVNVPADRIREQLSDLGLVQEIVNAKTGKTETVPLMDGDRLTSQILKFFTDADRPGPGEQKDLVVPVLIKGERRWFQMKDRDLYNAIQGLGTPELSSLMRWLSLPTRTLRTGATLSPEFAARNPVRDAWHAAVFSRGPTRPPFWHMTEGLFHYLKKDDVFQRWRASGGENSTMAGIDRPTIRRQLDELVKSKSALGAAGQLVRHPIDTLRMISSLTENGTRVGEFALTERQARRQGANAEDAATQAALNARDVNLDYNQSGTITRSANQIVAFLNAYARGQAQLLRELKERPEVVVPRALAWITVPSVALALAQQDDPAYQEVPRWRKDVSWVIVDRGTDQGEGWDGYGSGKVEHVWYIPKPFEIGVLFGTVPERVVEWLRTDDPEAMRSAGRAVRKAVTPPYIPTVLVPLIENFANRSTYRDGRPIVPRDREGLAPSEQFAPRTGETMRTLGNAINASPAKLENLARGYTGGLGGYALTGADAVVRGARSVLGEPPLKEPRAADEEGDLLTRTPGLRAFAGRPTGQDAESIELLYRTFDRAERLRLTWRKMAAEGRQAEADAYLERNRAAIESVMTSEDTGADSGGPLREAHREMRELRDELRGTSEPGDRALIIAAMQRLARETLRPAPAGR